MKSLEPQFQRERRTLEHDRRTLVIVPRMAAPCDVCGLPLAPGTEAARWFGRSLAHIGCTFELSGPRGGA